MRQDFEEIGPQQEQQIGPAMGPPAMFVFSTIKSYGVFNFSFPQPTLASSPPTPQYSSVPFCRKRARPLADIDGQSREITKKRRLRLTFVTSRLSAPFASPPRNNVDRGNSKVALWAKQRAVPTHQFRKMAILNRIKRETMAMREAQQRQIEIARQQHLEKMMAVAPRRTSKRLQSKKVSKQENAVTADIIPKPLTKQQQQQNLKIQQQQQQQIQYQQQQQQKQKQKYALQQRSSNVKEYRKIAPVAVNKQNIITPMHRRPPTPPSEEELDRQRKQRKRKTNL